MHVTTTRELTTSPQQSPPAAGGGGGGGGGGGAAAAQWHDDHYYKRRPTTTSNRNNNELHDSLYHTRSRSSVAVHKNNNSPRRLSTFTGRSRSNTTTTASTTSSSSRRSPSSSMSSSFDPPASSSSFVHHHDARVPFAAAAIRAERRESMTKSLLSRGSRILRRQGSKFNISATLDEEEEEMAALDHGNHKGRSNTSPDLFSSSTRVNKSRRSNEQLKRLISGPFAFHHMTHTSPAQFQTLDKTREVDLVTEFSAIRASQKPASGLKGIQADDIPPRTIPSSYSFPKYTATSPSVGQEERPSSVESMGSPTHQIAPPSTRSRSESRIFENFSRPIPRYPRTGSMYPPSNSPPALASPPDMSEPAPRAIDEILGLHTPQTYPENVYSTAEDTEKISAAMAQITLEGILQPNHGGTAEHARKDSTATTTNTNASDVEDVPCINQASAWNDSPEPDALQQQQQQEEACNPSSPAGLALSSVPLLPSCSNTDHSSTNASNATGSPNLSQGFPDNRIVENAAKDPSIAEVSVHEDPFESWDDDIDFCYEHAAESSCNFDWLCVSAEKPDHTLIGVPITFDDPGERSNGIIADQPQNKLPIALDPSMYRSQDNDDLVATQNDQVLGGEAFPVTMTTKPEESDEHFTRQACSQSDDVIQPVDLVLPRKDNNTSPMSACNSEESLILSRAASIVRRHRSSISANSVPDLVHSSTSSREGTVSESSTIEPSVLPTKLSTVPATVDRQDSPSHHHRQTRSIESHAILEEASGNDVKKGRARSISVGATKWMADRVVESEAERPQLPTKPHQHSAASSKGFAKGRRKRRVSYSVFPSSGGVVA